MLAGDSIMVPLSELQRRSGRDRRTIWRWLKRKGIRTEGRGVMVTELRTKWPELLDALGLRQGPPPCPDCGAPTVCECSVCGANVP
jgi:hypothetical protein